LEADERHGGADAGEEKVWRDALVAELARGLRLAGCRRAARCVDYGISAQVTPHTHTPHLDSPW
jgi:hypothetical protein